MRVNAPAGFCAKPFRQRGVHSPAGHKELVKAEGKDWLAMFSLDSIAYRKKRLQLVRAGRL